MLKVSKNIPIGIFDSGVGGLSVWEELIKILPNHQFLYFADNAYSPYGPRSVEDVIERSKKISKFLIQKGAGIIVIACNTATAAAIDSLRSSFSIPFIGMEPAIKPAAALTKTGVVGVLATKGTLGGSIYNKTLNLFASNIQVVEQVGTGLVQMVESGRVEGPELEKLLLKYIKPMVDSNADTIVLGCTHYSFLKKAIENIVGNKITIIDPAPAVARHLYKIAKENHMMDFRTCESIQGVDMYKRCYCNTHFYSSGNNLVLKAIARGIISQISNDCFIEINIDNQTE